MSQDTFRISRWVHYLFVPLFFLILCPPTAVVFWYVNTALGGSFQALGSLIVQDGFFSTIASIWLPVFWGSKTAWMIIASFAAFQLLLMRIIPGKPFLGPITPKGNVPVYKAAACLVRNRDAPHAAFSSWGLHENQRRRYRSAGISSQAVGEKGRWRGRRRSIGWRGEECFIHCAQLGASLLGNIGT